MHLFAVAILRRYKKSKTTAQSDTGDNEVSVTGCLAALEVDWSALFSTLVGAGAAVLGVFLGAVLERKRAAEARRAVVIGGVRALWAEMAVNMERYEGELAGRVRQLKDDDYLDINWPIHSDYFAAYAANAGLLGEVDDDQLAKDIIRTVTMAKGVVDSLRFNLELLHELKRVNDEGARTGWTSELEMRRLDLECQLALYGQNFVRMDELLSKAFSEISPRVAALG